MELDKSLSQDRVFLRNKFSISLNYRSGSSGAGAANVKVVRPVRRELNPNAKPFHSVKEELRTLTLLSRNEKEQRLNHGASTNQYAAALDNREFLR